MISCFWSSITDHYVIFKHNPLQVFQGRVPENENIQKIAEQLKDCEGILAKIELFDRVKENAPFSHKCALTTYKHVWGLSELLLGRQAFSFL